MNAEEPILLEEIKRGSFGADDLKRLLTNGPNTSPRRNILEDAMDAIREGLTAGNPTEMEVAVHCRLFSEDRNLRFKKDLMLP